MRIRRSVSVLFNTFPRREIWNGLIRWKDVSSFGKLENNEYENKKKKKLISGSIYFSL